MWYYLEFVIFEDNVLIDGVNDMIFWDLVMVFVNWCKFNVVYIYFFLINGYYVNMFLKWFKSNRIVWVYIMMSWELVLLSFKLGISFIIYV